MAYSAGAMKRARGERIRRRTAAAVLLATAVLLLFDAAARPKMRTIAGNAAVNTATALISTTVTSEIETLGLVYDDLVVIEYNDTGTVTAVKADSLKMNWLKSAVTSKVANVFNSIGEIPVSVPVGTLMGFSVFSGRGPNITLYTSLTGSITVNIKNEFETAGINQTWHRIVLEIKADMSILGLGGDVSASFNTNVPIAETIIVGLIPEIYAGADDNLWAELVN